MKVRIIKPTQKEIDQTKLKYLFLTKCLICGSESSKFRSNTKDWCGCCKAIVSCSFCSKEFKADLSRYRVFINILDLLNNKGQAFCSHSCSRKWHMNQMIDCSKHGKRMSFSGVCIGCNTERSMNINSSPGGCNQCGGYAQSRHPVSGYCKVCQNRKSIEAGILGYQKNISPGNCTNPSCQALCPTERKGNGYCQNCWNKLIRKMIKSSHEIMSAPGDCNQCGKYCPNGRNVSGSCGKCASKSLGYIQRFKQENGNLLVYDFSQQKYILWEKFKLKFKTNQIEVPKDFKVISTFRDQGSDSWRNARVLFEQHLKDLKISWFVYIKFYLDQNGKSKPIVAGISGSKKVNSMGSDVNFSTEVSHGPARLFLFENGYSWDKTQIAIKACVSREKALRVERGIILDYGLFGF